MDCRERIPARGANHVSFSGKCDWMLLRGLVVLLRVWALLEHKTQGPEPGVGASENKEDQDQHSMSSMWGFVVAELRLFCGLSAGRPKQAFRVWSRRRWTPGWVQIVQ